MTALDPSPTVTPAESWDAQFQALKARHPKVKDSIVFAIHSLQDNPGIALDDLKARAAMHGIRVTAASVTAARRLLSPPAPRLAANGALESAPAVRRRRTRTTPAAADPAVLIRQLVGEIQNQSAEEATRLRAAIRQAIDILQAALDA